MLTPALSLEALILTLRRGLSESRKSSFILRLIVRPAVQPCEDNTRTLDSSASGLRRSDNTINCPCGKFSSNNNTKALVHQRNTLLVSVPTRSHRFILRLRS
ncbi:hypothetical protein EDD85DRAFT_858602 [Armillaria nabsnona]|nr:hypothetical protein EDD85DRAFT_858602 [Armillaria nabsnona]